MLDDGLSRSPRVRAHPDKLAFDTKLLGSFNQLPSRLSIGEYDDNPWIDVVIIRCQFPDDIPVVLLLEMGVVNDDGVCQTDMFVFFNFLFYREVSSFSVIRIYTS